MLSDFILDELECLMVTFRHEQWVLGKVFSCFRVFFGLRLGLRRPFGKQWVSITIVFGFSLLIVVVVNFLCIYHCSNFW
jgi:hypothetical protein